MKGPEDLIVGFLCVLSGKATAVMKCEQLTSMQFFSSCENQVLYEMMDRFLLVVLNTELTLFQRGSKSTWSPGSFSVARG